MSSRILSLLAAVALLAAAVGAHAATIRVPAGQPTIQQGLDAASVGDTVLVAPGTYTGPLNRDIDFDGGSVTLRGEAGAGGTVIDCQGLGRGFYFYSGEDTTAIVEGFTIQNAAADTGAGVMCRNGSSPKFLHCTFLNNTATVRGGAACSKASSPIFWFCEFNGNSAAVADGSYGGAMACLSNSDPAFRGCAFTSNAGGGYGGAVYGSDSSPRFSNCSFTDGIAAWGGGGAFLVACPSAAFTDCVFTGNSGSQGGAIYTQSASITATGCTFSDGGQRAVTFLYGSASHLDNCVFLDNYSHFHCFLGANALVTNCTFVGATSTYAALTAHSASPTFEHCIFAFSPDGRAFVCDDSTANPTFTRCVLYENADGNELCGAVSDTLHRDPRFCGMASGDYALCEDSVCAPGNNAWGELIGALDVDCLACGSPVERTTWGGIKALYR